MKNVSLYLVDGVLLTFDDVLSLSVGDGIVDLLCYDSEYSFMEEEIKEIKMF